MHGRTDVDGVRRPRRPAKMGMGMDGKGCCECELAMTEAAAAAAGAVGRAAGDDGTSNECLVGVWDRKEEKERMGEAGRQAGRTCRRKGVEERRNCT